MIQMNVPAEVFYNGFVTELDKIANIASPAAYMPVAGPGSPNPPTGTGTGQRRPRIPVMPTQLPRAPGSSATGMGMSEPGGA